MLAFDNDLIFFFYHAISYNPKFKCQVVPDLHISTAEKKTGLEKLNQDPIMPEARGVIMSTSSQQQLQLSLSRLTQTKTRSLPL